MKRQTLWRALLAAFFLLMLTASAAQADWQQVGMAGFSRGQADYISLAMDSSGVPYVAYQDWANGYKASVMRFNSANSSWEQVGVAGFSPGRAEYTNLAIDGSDTPYVAYADWANGYKASVMRFNGTSWEQVGAAGFSPGGANFPSLAIDSSGTPYITYSDSANSYKASVMKFSGGWTQVGAAGFSATGVDYTSLAIDSSGTPYVTYKENSNGYKASMMRFNGTSWEQVGAAGFSAGSVSQTSVAIDSSGRAYVSYKDGAKVSKASVMRFNGTSWEQVGTAGFSPSVAYDISMALDNSGRPYVAYKDWGNAYFKASVMRFNGTSWEQVGTAGFSAGEANYTSLAIDSSGRLYVAYQDSANNYKASVMKFVQPNQPPTANAGDNQSVVQGEKVCFDGSKSSDPDGDELTYTWTFTALPDGSSAALDDPTAVKPCFTADLPGTYTVSLTVNDGTEDSAPSTASAVALSKPKPKDMPWIRMLLLKH